MAYDQQLIVRLGNDVPMQDARALATKRDQRNISRNIPICSVTTHANLSGGEINPPTTNLATELRKLTEDSRLFIMGHGCSYRDVGFCVGDLSGSKLAEELVTHGLCAVKKISVVSCEAAKYSWPEDFLNKLVDCNEAFQSTTVSARTMLVGIVTDDVEDAGTHFSRMGTLREEHEIRKGQKKLHRSSDAYLLSDGRTAVAKHTTLHHGEKQKKEYSWDERKGKVKAEWVDY